MAIKPGYLPESDAAAYLGFSVSTLQKWRNRGVGPIYRKAGARGRSRVRYRLVDLDDWMDEHLVEPQGDGGAE